MIKTYNAPIASRATSARAVKRRRPSYRMVMDLLFVAQALVSMSATGNPYDKAKAESFFKTLKYEEVYLKEYQTLVDAQAHLGQFIEAVYNQKRLHSSLGYLPPAEFEATQMQCVAQLT